MKKKIFDFFLINKVLYIFIYFKLSCKHFEKINFNQKLVDFLKLVFQFYQNFFIYL